MAPLDRTTIYPAGSSSAEYLKDKLARAAVAHASPRHRSSDIEHGRITAIVLCALFVGAILVAVVRMLCHKAGCCAAHPNAADASDNDDNNNNASGSDGASIPPGAAYIAWEDMTPGWGGGGASVGAAGSGLGRRGGLRRPRPTVPRERDRAGWKTPPPPYTPPPSYDLSGPEPSPYAVFGRRAGQVERPDPA